MLTIWKYKLGADRTVLEMPIGARILTVQMQHGSPCLWAVVDEQVAKENRSFIVVGTGWELPTNAKTYLGTFQVSNGNLIFHVFEEG